MGLWAAVAAFFPVVGIILGLSANDSILVGLSAELAVHVVFGFGGSYLLHEAGHIVLLSRYPSVEGIDVTASWTRFSVHPRGSLSPLQVIAVGLIGPVGCFVIGAGLWLLGSNLAFWYMGHIIFLLPIFGDGRAVLLSLTKMRAVL